MNSLAPLGSALAHAHELSELPEGLELFARIEGLVGEEAVLLATPPEQRTDHQRERLRVIATELDRIWERLHLRAERLAGHGRDETARPHPDGS